MTMQAGESRRPSSGIVDPAGLQVRYLLTRPLVTCPPDASIQEAARLMARADAPSVVLVDPSGQPLGIVTDSDLRRRVLAAGLDPATPLEQIASAPIVSIDGMAAFFEAAQLMLSHNLHHLVVVDAGARPLGVLSDSDLMAARAGGPLFIARQIDQAPTLERLAALGGVRANAIRLLVHAGASGETIGRLTAETNDRLVRRILGLLEAELGPPPVPYCWLGIGSEGRREQGLKTDQDNALVYADPPSDLADEAAGYFERLATRAVAALVACGFPECKGGMMATTPAWREPLGNWRLRFASWIRRPEPEALYGAELFFDLRGLFGDLTLAERLWGDVLGWVGESPVFGQLMLKAALDHRPAIGLFGRFALERTGEHRGRFHIKNRGLMPVVEVARAYALTRGVPETNTFERLRALRARGAIPARDADDVLAAYELLTRLRYRQHVAQLDAGQPLHDYVDPNRLARGDRQALREYLQVIADVQGYIESQVAVGARA